jgi:hypothetical protein
VEEKLTDPRINIDAGARHLAYLLKRFKGELTLAVAAYNAGEGAVQRAGNRVPDFRETQGYVKTVLGLYGVFKPVPQAVAAAAAPAGAARLAQAGARTAGARVRVELGGAPSPAPAPAPSVAALALQPVRYAPADHPFAPPRGE